jgi:hypothetical protein
LTAEVVTTVDRAWVTLTGAAVFLCVAGDEGLLVLPLVFGVHCSIAVFEHVTKTGDDLLEHTLREPRAYPDEESGSGHERSLHQPYGIAPGGGIKGCSKNVRIRVNKSVVQEENHAR